jgi:ketosteroid isomerase-like protein
MMESENVATVRRYLRAIETNGDVLGFYHPDVVMEELPNRIVPNGAVRDLAALSEANARGRQVIREQRYEVRGVMEDGDRVALEVLWTGVLAIPVSTLAAGDEMRAHFALFIDFRDGKIFRQRNYDCYEPW